MKFSKILTSFTFRFMLLYVLALSGVVFLLMAMIYGIFSYNYFQDLRVAIVEELETMSLIYEGQGVTGVKQYIDDSQQASSSHRFHFLLTDPAFNKLAGTLNAWPDYREFGDGWVSFGLSVTDFTNQAPELELMARPHELSDGSHLLVALRYNDVIASARLVMATLIRTMLATLVLGVLGGFFAAAGSVRRIEEINEGISDIVHGDLSNRIPLGDSIGNMRQLIENFNDMLDQTESLMKGVRTVADNIAHDLRTPLTHIRNHLARLQQHVPAQNEEQVREIIDECDGILSTFNSLLRIAQLEAGNRISDFTRLDLGALVADVVDLYEPLASEKDISVHYWCDEFSYDGDRDLLFQMLANLLDNAVKYTPQGGNISVTLNVNASGIPGLQVSDSGPGIPVADRENVFRRFFRLESSRGMQPGNGLGLSLVQAVVKLHRGSIQLRDNHPGLKVVISLK
jgi:signal transduction histidine kinase